MMRIFASIWCNIHLLTPPMSRIVVNLGQILCRSISKLTAWLFLNTGMRNSASVCVITSRASTPAGRADLAENLSWILPEKKKQRGKDGASIRKSRGKNPKTAKHGFGSSRKRS